MDESETLGKLVRARRKAMGLSQEALAALVFDDPTRKSHISVIENARKNVTPGTVRSIALVLGIERHEVPARYRWLDDRETPVPTEPVPLGIDLDLTVVQRRVARPPPEEYRRALVRGLRHLRHWTGPPFGLRSLGVSMTIAFVYTIMFGCLAYMQGGGAIGVVDVFSVPHWARELSPGTLASSIAVLLAGTGAVIMHLLATRPAASGGVASKVSGSDARAPPDTGAVTSSEYECRERLGRPRHGRRAFMVRVMFLGAVLGGAAMAAGALGVDQTAAACFMAIVAFAALATRGRADAALAGALGGTIAGLSAGAIGGQDAGAGMLTGSAMGVLVGGIAGYSAAAVAESAPQPRSAALTGAGVGVAVASVITIFALTLVYLALDARGGMTSLDSAALSVFLVVWVTLPLANAAVDYLSLGISHVLGRQAIHRSRTVTGISLLILCDLAAALSLMVATTAVLAVGLVLANALSPWDFDPARFFEGAAADPFGAGIWFSLMILSTLSWTVLHCAFVVAPAAAARISSTVLHSRLIELHRADTTTGRLSLPTVLLAHTRPHITAFIAGLIFVFGTLIALVAFRIAWDFLGLLGVGNGPFEWLAKVGLSITEALSSVE